MVGKGVCVHGGQSKVSYFACCFCYSNLWDVKIMTHMLYIICNLGLDIGLTLTLLCK